MAISQIVRAAHPPPILVLTGGIAAWSTEAYQRGARCFLLKHTVEAEEFTTAIHDILQTGAPDEPQQ